VRGRILDLSERAARRLGIVGRGRARVVMEIAEAAPADEEQAASR
jgi:rare lipoprotein A (peptidoglycan hydrolase)